MQVVKLRNQDLEYLLLVVEKMLEYKMRNLKPENWQKFEQDYLPSLVSCLSENQFPVNSSARGIIPWLIDNIRHSREPIPGVKQKYWPWIEGTEVGGYVLDFLSWARSGPANYQCWCRQNSPNNSLFS